MFCPQCGSNNEDGARFCYSCGRQLSDGTQPAGTTGPAWRSFGTPTPPPPPPPVVPVPPPVPPPVYQPPVPPPQIVIGIPREDSSGGMWLLAAACLVLVGAVAFAVIRFADVNTDSWPLVGKGENKEAGITPSKPEGILVSLTTACKDTKGQPCTQVWDITGVRATPTETAIDYEVKATGQGGCSVDVPSDQTAAQRQEAAGRPGPFLEGARGRFYPLLSSTGLTQAGGALPCNATQKGTWTFPPVTGETTLKLRHPSVPPARIDLTPLTVRSLPPNDPLAVIPVPAGACTTTQNQQCRGAWEIGPYGVAADKTVILFFNVRYDGPQGCTINWQPDLGTHQALVRQGQKGLHLEVPGQPDLTMIAGGGVAAENKPQPCGQVLSGFWRFAAGNLAPTVSFFYPDFPPVQVPIRPQ